MIRRLFLLSRPRFWFYLGGTFLLGSVIGANTLEHLQNGLFFVLLIYFFPIANIFLYGINDVFDQETDAINEKKDERELRFSEEKDTHVIFVLWLIAAISALFLFFLPNTPSRVFFAIFFFLSYAYSAPPFRFKAKPILDFLSNVLYIMPGLVSYSLFTDSWPGAVAVLAGGFWAMAMHLYSAIPDINPDKESGVITSAVFLGRSKAIWVCITFWTIFSILVISQGWFGQLGIISIVYPVLGIYTAMSLHTINKIYWVYPWVNTITGGIAFFYFFQMLEKTI